MIPPEMFIKVTDAKTSNDMWLHVPAIDCVKHVEEDKYSFYMNGTVHEVLVENAKNSFPFLFSDVN